MTLKLLNWKQPHVLHSNWHQTLPKLRLKTTTHHRMGPILLPLLASARTHKPAPNLSFTSARETAQSSVLVWAQKLDHWTDSITDPGTSQGTGINPNPNPGSQTSPQLTLAYTLHLALKLTIVHIKDFSCKLNLPLQNYLKLDPYLEPTPNLLWARAYSQSPRLILFVYY